MRHIYKCPYNDEVDCIRMPDPGHCTRCGFCPTEAAYRNGCMESQQSYRIDPDGLKRLHIRKEHSNAKE